LTTIRELPGAGALEHRQGVDTPALIQAGAIAQPTFAFIVWVEVGGEGIAEFPALGARMEAGSDEIEFLRRVIAGAAR